MTTSPLKRVLAEKGVSQRAVAEALGVSKQAVAKWANGCPPRLENLRRLSDFLGVPIAALTDDGSSTPLCDPTSPEFRKVDSFTVLHGEGWTTVPVLDAFGGCHPMGAFEQTGEVIGSVEFSDEFLSSLPGVVGSLTRERFCLVAAIGDSMEPTINQRDHCLVDLSQKSIRGEGIYWLRIEDGFFLKRIARNFDRSITLISDNDKYPPQVIPRDVLDSAEIIGRVVQIISLKDA